MRDSDPRVQHGRRCDYSKAAAPRHCQPSGSAGDGARPVLLAATALPGPPHGPGTGPGAALAP